jgi:HEAT repeat protein
MALQIVQNMGYRDKEMVPGLVECLKDKAAMVRIQACGLLSQLGGEAKAAIPALRELLNDADAGVRNAAQNALNVIDLKKK